MKPNAFLFLGLNFAFLLIISSVTADEKPQAEEKKASKADQVNYYGDGGGYGGGYGGDYGGGWGGGCRWGCCGGEWGGRGCRYCCHSAEEGRAYSMANNEANP